MPTGCGQKKQYASLSAAEDDVAHGQGRRCTRPRTTLHTAEDDVVHGRGQQTRRDVVLKIAGPSIGMPVPRTVPWQHVHTLCDRK